MVYIYGLKDPRDGEIHYVGKSVHPKKRLAEHMRCDDGNKHKVNWIVELKEAGLKPELVILDEATADNWQTVERSWIAKGMDADWPLTNIVHGDKVSSDKPAEDYSFMRSYIPPRLWGYFERMNDEQKDRICLAVAQAMETIRMPILEHKIATGQLEMVSINMCELVQAASMVAVFKIMSMLQLQQ